MVEGSLGVPQCGRQRGAGCLGGAIAARLSARVGALCETHPRRGGRPQCSPAHTCFRAAAPRRTRTPYDTPLRDGNRDRLIGLLTERAAKTLMIYLMELNPVRRGPGGLGWRWQEGLAAAPSRRRRRQACGGRQRRQRRAHGRHWQCARGGAEQPISWRRGSERGAAVLAAAPRRSARLSRPHAHELPAPPPPPPDSLLVARRVLQAKPHPDPWQLERRQRRDLSARAALDARPGREGQGQGQGRGRGQGGGESKQPGAGGKSNRARRTACLQQRRVCYLAAGGARPAPRVTFNPTTTNRRPSPTQASYKTGREEHAGGVYNNMRVMGIDPRK